jgi:hypothetical protein
LKSWSGKSGIGCFRPLKKFSQGIGRIDLERPAICLIQLDWTTWMGYWAWERMLHKLTLKIIWIFITWRDRGSKTILHLSIDETWTNYATQFRTSLGFASAVSWKLFPVNLWRQGSSAHLYRCFRETSWSH